MTLKEKWEAVALILLFVAVVAITAWGMIGTWHFHQEENAWKQEVTRRLTALEHR